MAVRFQYIRLLLNMLMHLFKCRVKDIGNSWLNVNSIISNLDHFVFNVWKLLFDQSFLLIKLNIIFLSTIECITISLINFNQGILVVFLWNIIFCLLSSFHNTHTAISQTRCNIVELIFSIFMAWILTHTKVFRLLFHFDLLMVL